MTLIKTTADKSIFSWELISSNIPRKYFLENKKSFYKIYEGCNLPISKITINGEYEEITIDKEVIKLYTSNQKKDCIIKAAIRKILKEILGDKNWKSISLNSHCEFIKTHFHYLGPKELRYAFELAAAKIINADLNYYGTKFNNKIIGEVLNKYSLYRKDIISIIQKAKNKVQAPVSDIPQENTSKKNIEARKQLVNLCIASYSNFYYGKEVKFIGGIISLFSRLNFPLEGLYPRDKRNEPSQPIQTTKKKKALNINNPPPTQKNRQLNFYHALKKINITPDDFSKDIHKKLKSYEQNINTQNEK